MATLEAFSSACFVVVSGAYFDAKSEQNAAFSRSSTRNSRRPIPPSVFEQVLKITAKVFGASVGVLMLKEMGTNRLQARAKLGFDGDGDFSVEIGQDSPAHRGERRSGHGAGSFPHGRVASSAFAKPRAHSGACR